MEKSSFEKPEIEKEMPRNKVEGLFSTVDTLINLKEKGAKKFAVLSFCELILDELVSEDPNLEVIELKNEIRETREAVKKEDADIVEDKMKSLVERIKDLYKK